MEPTKLTIRLKPQLQDYIRYIMLVEGDADPEKILTANSRSYLGKLITPFLSYRPVDHHPLFAGNDCNLFTFILPIYNDVIETRCNTVWISEKNQVNIQKIVEHHFRLHFRFFADDKVRYQRETHTQKGSIKRTIYQFCSDMNIKYDDVTYDMISKAYYRSRKKSIKCGIVPGETMMIGQLFFLR
jgi:hypothetical protein